ncbi:MAG TPA: hypothetical protein VG820_08595, partial [Fimbriimonadaceae bacterium]|nr:hypothetical protein [Fimbriimonadaceae bacterium]
DRVRVIDRPVTEEDRKKNRYFEHMANLSGSIQTIYNSEEIAVRVDPAALTSVTKNVHDTALERMREKFLASVSEEQKKQLTPEELEFDAHYVLLVRAEDLEKA